MRDNTAFICVLAAMFAMVLSGQSSTSTIVGTVRDQSGAVIPGVEVIITHLETNRVVRATSNARGEFTSVPLSVGQYRVEATSQGFKKAIRSGVTLELNQTAVIDLSLSVGEAAERIEVVANASQLETTTSTMGQVVNNRQIRELPLNTRNVYSLIFLTPGVVGSTSTDSADASNWAVYGTRRQLQDIVIDGVPAAHPTANGFTGVSIFPSVDAIQEFKLMGATFSAEYGRSVGSVLNIVYKSGSNRLHGSAYDFVRNSVLDANGFFANRAGQALGSFRRNQYGGTLSGPIKRDKTFFLGSFEGLRERNFTSSGYSVPTALQRTGDFSQTRASNATLVRVFDPYSTRANPAGGFIRDQFPNNVIPASRLNPVALNVIRYYPLPTQTGDANTNLNNFFKSGSSQLDLDNLGIYFESGNIRLFPATAAQKVFIRYSHRDQLSGPPMLFSPDTAVAEGRIVTTNGGNNVAAEYSNTLSPTAILTVRTGFSRTLFTYGNQGLGFVPSSLGLPKAIDTAAAPAMFPYFTVSGYKTLGSQDHRRTAFNSYSLNASLNRTLGQHTLKVGFEGRMIRTNLWEARAPSGSFPFSATFTQGPNPLSASSTAGNSVASLLLGTGNSGNKLYTFYKNVAAQNFYLAGYVQDDWRVTSRLTLNLGLRYDIETPRTERFDHLNFFDPDVRSPLADKVPGFPDLRGGLVYVGVNGRNRYQFGLDSRNFAPRLGLAYQLSKRTVLRGGYAHVYAPSLKAASGSDTPWGFRGETSWISSLDGMTPLNTLSNPYPDGFAVPPGTSEGLLSGTGDDIRPLLYTDKAPWTQQWNFTLQHELPAQTIIETGYVGTRGFELPLTIKPSQLRPEYLALGSKLNELVANPFYGIVKRGILNSPTVTRGQLLRPFPQYGDMEGGGRDTGGKSWYHGMLISARNRMWHGVQFEGSYTWSKTFDMGESFQDYYNIADSRALSSTEQRHNFIMSFLYEIPFEPLGQGTALRSESAQSRECGYRRLAGERDRLP
ncbi:MAG: TonB-dependent receptor [Candidatus Solibacter sp.]|nr:TonB-dependent receptor [Candidatus Solibacter sp.]